MNVYLEISPEQVGEIVAVELAEQLENPMGLAKKDRKAIQRVLEFYSPYLDMVDDMVVIDLSGDEGWL